LRDLALATTDPEVTARLSSRPGVYAQVLGPQLETPAEIAWLRAAGADVVGMSMAVETIAARDAGAEVLGLSVVTNRAATAEVPTDIDGIHGVGVEAGPAVAAIVRHVVGSLP
jgi:purine-nucleoside phosphorylase